MKLKADDILRYSFPTGHKDLPPTYLVVAGADPWRDMDFLHEGIFREECGVRTNQPMLIYSVVCFMGLEYVSECRVF